MPVTVAARFPYVRISLVTSAKLPDDDRQLDVRLTDDAFLLGKGGLSPRALRVAVAKVQVNSFEMT